MTLFPLLLFLSAVLPPSIPQEHYEHMNFADLSTTRVSVQEEIVNKHNQLRRMVSPPGSDLLKMQWSNDILVDAQKWASSCSYHRFPNAEKSVNLLCSENIFMSSYPTSWSHVIQRWYDEAKNFTFGSGPKSPNAVVGNYTQVVWNSSYQIACAVAKCNGITPFVYICHYSPRPNIEKRPYNPYTVGEPCALCPDHCDNGLCTNSCEYHDTLFRCEDYKRHLTCDFIFVKQECEATCQCEGKIH